MQTILVLNIYDDLNLTTFNMGTHESKKKNTLNNIETDNSTSGGIILLWNHQAWR